MPYDYDFSHENHPVMLKQMGNLLSKGRREFHYYCPTCKVDFTSLKWSAGSMELIWKSIEELQSQVEYLNKIIYEINKERRNG